MRTEVSGQQLVILAHNDGTDEGLSPLGTRKEIIEQLGIYNTAPETAGGDVLYGPGIRIELPPDEPVRQMLMTIVEEEIAWLVIMRLAKGLHWRLLDPVSGRELQP